MRRFVRPAVWTAVFVVCAGAGAYLAAHTDPFPPGVDRPTGTGATGPSGPSPSPSPVDRRWTGAMPLAARHDLYVGGSCRSRWRTDVHLVIQPDGSVAGDGLAEPVGQATCDFPQAQQQARRIRLSVQGRETVSGDLRITFEHVTPEPAGSTDLGGVVLFLVDARLLLPVDGTVAAQDLHVERGDGNRGTYVIDGRIRLRCAAGCAA